MGHRAHYVIIENGSWEMFYSHWGAVDLTTNLMFGPDFALEFVRRQLKSTMAGMGWSHEMSCEAAVIIDLDEHQLAYFTKHHCGQDKRAATQDVLAIAWPEWKTIWLYNGLIDILAYLNEDPPQVSIDQGSYPRPLQRISPRHRANCLLSVTSAHRTRAYALDNHASEVISQADQAARNPPIDARIERCRLLPDAGVHLDVDHGQAGVWSINPLYGALDWNSVQQSDWQWTMWQDDMAQQLKYLTRVVRMPARDRGQALNQLQADIDRLCFDDPVDAAKQSMSMLPPTLRDDLNPLCEPHHVSLPDQTTYASTVTTIAALSGVIIPNH